MPDHNPDPLQKQCPDCDDNDLVRLPTFPAQDATLSFDARGLLAYLYTLEGEPLTLKDLEQGCGRDKVHVLINELEAAGYLQRRQRRISGKFESREFILHDAPVAQPASTDWSTGYVYLVHPEGHNAYKIGTAKDVPQRIARLQQKMETPLVVLHTIACVNPVTTERQLHRKYKQFHLDGDWFVLPDWAVAEIKDM
jgi:hypothetical protein